jgi:hypothetical protein
MDPLVNVHQAGGSVLVFNFMLGLWNSVIRRSATSRAVVHASLLQ